MNPITKVAIANRGEVAARIIRACKELGIPTVLLHSEADIGSKAFRMSDTQVCIGGSIPLDSYLSIEKTVDGAIAGGADAIHPGFGFLSENADLARACEAKGIRFIGPTAETIETMGDKIKAKKIIEEAGLPIIPGYNGEDQCIDNLVAKAVEIGFPVIAKATSGGGGRGMKIITSKVEAAEKIQSAKRESQSAFGSDKVFLEKYLDKAKHIEVQVFGDLIGNTVHLFERECSVQRRHQKVIEEAPSGSLSEELRARITDAAWTLAAEVKYLCAGTVEFLVQDGEFYFLEMNTRLQVEHPVTELILGIDLVKAQIQILNGEMPLWLQDEVAPRGHAMECRIYAEDPETVGIPSVGVLGYQKWPEGPGIRVDYGFDEGDEITSYYDSMIAKLIVYDETRPRVIRKMLTVLDEAIVFGVKTNIPLLKQILSHPDFLDGSMDTSFIAEHFPEGIKDTPNFDLTESKVKEIYQKLGSGGVSKSKKVDSPWAQGWSNT